MATGGHIGNVTWKQIDIKSCVIPLFLLILAWRIHFWHRVCILTSPTIKIQDGRLRPYWKCNLKVNGHRNPCKITFPTKCDIESPFWHHFCILMSPNIKIQDGRPLPKLVFNNTCLFTGIISCVLTSPNIKIQDGHQRSYWKFNTKENSPGNRYNHFSYQLLHIEPISSIICVLWQVLLSKLKMVAICHFHCFQI